MIIPNYVPEQYGLDTAIRNNADVIKDILSPRSDMIEELVNNDEFTDSAYQRDWHIAQTYTRLFDHDPSVHTPSAYRAIRFATELSRLVLDSTVSPDTSCYARELNEAEDSKSKLAGDLKSYLQPRRGVREVIIRSWKPLDVTRGMAPTVVKSMLRVSFMLVDRSLAKDYYGQVLQNYSDET